MGIPQCGTKMIFTPIFFDVPYLVIGNMLGNKLETMGTHWEVKRIWCEHHGNLLGIWWEFFFIIKTTQICFLESSLKINQISGPIGLRTINQENLMQPQS